MCVSSQRLRLQDGQLKPLLIPGQIEFLIVEEGSDLDLEAAQLFCVCATRKNKKKKQPCHTQDTGEGADLNRSDTEGEDPSSPAKEQKAAGGLKNWGTCSIPCDVTIKLLRDEKHSICGKKKKSLFGWR